jgi:tRNA(Arg) A34 adenosine deaminase TadA
MPTQPDRRIEMERSTMADYLDEPWRSCFELAWESFCAGSIPVGAVVVNARGEIVARGRNRRSEATGPTGNLANTAIAHAEINAIAALPVGNYSDHAIFTNLEPCLLCTAAMVHVRLGRAVFAASDPALGGIEGVPQILPYTADRWPVREGPLETPLADVSLLLSIMNWLRIDSGHAWVSSIKDRTPSVYEAAVQLWESDKLEAMHSMSATSVFQRLAEILAPIGR